MKIKIGYRIKTTLNEIITITGYRQIRGKYIYTFRDSYNSRGFITRENLLNSLNSGAKIL